jgi:subtilisin
MTAPPQATTGDVGDTTGRYIVIYKDPQTDASAARATLASAAGIRRIAASGDYAESAVASEALAGGESVHFDKLGISLISGDAAAAVEAAAADVDSAILAIEPEYIAYPSAAPYGSPALEYVRGYRDAVNQLYEQLVSRGEALGADADVSAAFEDTPEFTWGLQATGANTSRFSGQGIRVAVLDTGMDLEHPDFRGRAIVSQFFAGAPVQDIYGHGTHCIGTACGPQRPSSGVRRYGLAYGAQIYVGKVFNNNTPRPGAPTGSVIAGIEWALANGCVIASLSLGAPINQKVQQYEVPIQRALNAGLLVICAAGNNASRPANVGFVEPPANADAAMAVAAVDNRLQIASFSARSSTVTGAGGIVNIAAPGIGVFSSVPVARGSHGLMNGTSMATPHVSGIAALIAQASGLRGNALWNRLLQTAKPLTAQSADVGAGLVYAPQ